MVVFWTVGVFFFVLGVTFLPIIGIVLGISAMALGSWVGLYLIRRELQTPHEQSHQ